jgi:hypothetical protein
MRQVHMASPGNRLGGRSTRDGYREDQPGNTRGGDRHDAIPRELFMNKFRQLGLIDYNGHLEVHSSLLKEVAPVV